MDKLNNPNFTSNVNAQASNDPNLAGTRVVSNDVEGTRFLNAPISIYNFEYCNF